MHNFDIWGQNSFFCGTAILVKGTYHQYSRGNNFPIGPTPKKILFLRYGSLSGAPPKFWPFFGGSATEGQLPLILVQDQWNFWHTSISQNHLRWLKSFGFGQWLTEKRRFFREKQWPKLVRAIRAEESVFSSENLYPASLWDSACR